MSDSDWAPKITAGYVERPGARVYYEVAVKFGS